MRSQWQLRKTSCIAFILILGCGVYTTEPLFTAKDSEIDTNVIGTWRVHDEDFVISADEHDKSLKCFVNGESEEPLVIRTRKLGKHTFWTFHGDFSLEGAKRRKASEAKSEASGVTPKHKCDFGRYVCVSKDKIELYVLDPEKVAQAIKSGDLKGDITYVPVKKVFGQVPQKAPVHYVHIKSSAAELSKYLTDHPDDCFDLKTPVLILNRSTQNAK